MRQILRQSAAVLGGQPVPMRMPNRADTRKPANAEDASRFVWPQNAPQRRAAMLLQVTHWSSTEYTIDAIRSGYRPGLSANLDSLTTANLAWDVTGRPAICGKISHRLYTSAVPDTIRPSRCFLPPHSTLRACDVPIIAADPQIALGAFQGTTRDASGGIQGQ